MATTHHIVRVWYLLGCIWHVGSITKPFCIMSRFLHSALGVTYARMMHVERGTRVSVPGCHGAQNTRKPAAVSTMVCQLLKSQDAQLHWQASDESRLEEVRHEQKPYKPQYSANVIFGYIHRPVHGQFPERSGSWVLDNMRYNYCTAQVYFYPSRPAHSYYTLR
jgi:hypothetical protein